MEKKFHPEKKFISNFEVLKHPDLFLTKKIFFGNFFFPTLDHPPVKKKKIQVFLTHEIPSETP
jgi:hypothetical protein